MLEEKLFSQFDSADTQTFIDLGAGLGSNTVYYSNKLDCAQQWLLIEKDEILANQALAFLQQQLNGSLINNEFFWQNNRTARVIRKDVSALEGLTELAQASMVVANAFFDILTLEQLEKTIEAIAKYKVPLLTTLNYQSMCFDDEDPLNDEYIALYERHMQLERPEGPRLANTAPAMLEKLLTGFGYEVETAESVWQVPSSDKLFADYLNFMQKAIAEIISPEKVVTLEKWLAAKREQKGVTLWVEHIDLLAL